MMLSILSPRRDFLCVDDIPEVSRRPYPLHAPITQNSASSTSSSHRSSRSADSRVSPQSSVSSHTRTPTLDFGLEVPRLTKTPWELERNKKNSTYRRPKQTYVFPAEIFKKLPREVYDCIVEQLERLHFERDQPCPSCYLKDLYNISLTSRGWDRAATIQMYRKAIVLATSDHPRMPKLRFKGTSRLKLLRRTLRERPALARYVRELHMSDFQTLYREASIEREEIVNLVASLVMACPNLERLVGFQIPYTHSFDRLSHALSTRPMLKERLWMLEDPDVEVDEEEEYDTGNNYHYISANDPTERFLELNSNHLHLHTLILHQRQLKTSTRLTFRAIIGTLRNLPSLRNLTISNLPSTSFTNLTLNALPSNLHSLRLENLPGITDMGLQRFASSPAVSSLSTLYLLNLEITSLTTIAHFLGPELQTLRHFILAQHKAPCLPPSSSQTPELSFHSPTLRSLHWELRSQAGPPSLPPPFPHTHHTSNSNSTSNPTSTSQFQSSASNPGFPFPNSEPMACLASTVLATSIRKGYFPALRKVRVPYDAQGYIQGLCKPLATALLPEDRAVLTSAPRGSLMRRHGRSDSMASYRFPRSEGLEEVGRTGSVSSTHTRGSTSTSGQSKFARADSPMSHSVPFPESSFYKPNSTTTKHAPSPSHSSSTYTHQPSLSRSPSLSSLSPLTISPFSPTHTRFLAQARLSSARQTPFVRFLVTSPTGETLIDRPIYSFLGTLSSNIVYDLKPDKGRGGTGLIGQIDEAKGMGDEDMHGERGKADGEVARQSTWILRIEDVMGESEDLSLCRRSVVGGCRHYIYGSRNRMGWGGVEIGGLF